ncbi:ABC transporter permease [Marmoricola endophyticus]|uniref:ABC transporter permease n=1 Tax=Marmoricola endophyticus TaxID=2040280 RepID=A0A917BMD6_9ACTN|nr:ABC transporter permease subunit [Marmoricola endophyticus]GGF50439.1 ABC transporter permease [Marmoricola endophyticus]
MSTGTRWIGRVVVGALLVVPLAVALAGPWVAHLAPDSPQAPFSSSTWSPFGTDRLGRDVLAAVLEGGRPLVVTAGLTVAAAYLVGSVVGLAAATTRHAWVDDLLMRPVDVALCFPSLLVVLVAALRSDGSGVAIAVAVGLTLVAPIARFVRMAARDVVQGPAMDALRLQGAGLLDRYARHAAGRLARPVAADLGVRLTAAIYVLASANFIGIGFDTTSPDWAVSVAANKDGLSLAPWSVALPALLIVALVLGLNLLGDAVLGGPDRLRWTRTARRG